MLLTLCLERTRCSNGIDGLHFGFRRCLLVTDHRYSVRYKARLSEGAFKNRECLEVQEPMLVGGCPAICMT